MLKELAWDVLRKGATIERARAAGLFADELVEGGRVSDLATVLCEIAQHDAGLALAVFSHFTARALSGEVAPGGELLAFSPFLESEATLSGEALSGRIPSVALAPLAQQAVVALQGGGFALVSLAGARLSEAVATLGSRSCPLVDISFDRARAKSLGDGA
ncbi:MAG: hypothetical protein HY075_15715, partial [Deltaproteobacteria bacterium]|nr:hypothetical protein [Deltaproteobacteria bacterium]